MRAMVSPKENGTNPTACPSQNTCLAAEPFAGDAGDAGDVSSRAKLVTPLGGVWHTFTNRSKRGRLQYLSAILVVAKMRTGNGTLWPKKRATLRATLAGWTAKTPIFIGVFRSVRILLARLVVHSFNSGQQSS